MTGPHVRRFPTRAAGVMIAAVLGVASAPGQDDKNAVRPVRVVGNVFGGDDVEMRFRVGGPADGRVAWRLALGTATVKAGELPLGAGDVAVKFASPEVKDGVVLPLKLTLGTAGRAAHEHDLWVFPRDPFAGRGEWLKGLDLHLFDPKGDTAKVLAAAKVPFEAVRSVEALADLKAGVVVIGEGVSFKDERGLGAALPKLAAAGAAVLVLAPADGEVPVPGLGRPAGGFGEVALRRDMVRRLDKRLDPDGWAGDGPTVFRSLVVKAGDEGVVAEVGAGGWPWAEARQEPGRGRWLFCGLAVVAKWDAGPTPRFLFARMMEHLTGPAPGDTKKEDGR